MICLVILSAGAGPSAPAVDVLWLLVREGPFTSKGEEGDCADSAGALGSLVSPSGKVISSFVLRPSQSAELRCREELGVVGLGFLSRVEVLRSSVENLMSGGGEEKSPALSLICWQRVYCKAPRLDHTHLTDCLRDCRPSGVDTREG